MRVAAFTLVLVAAGCHHDAVQDEVYDFAGLTPDQSAAVGDAGAVDGGAVDGGLVCDPGAALDGGTAVGSWSVQGGCATAEAFYQLSASCPSITYDELALTASAGGAPSGTFSLFEPDSYTRSLDATINARALVPKACVPNGCASYATTTAQELDWLHITCAAQGNDCLCPVSADIGIASQTGVWAPTSTGFTLTPTADVASTFITGVSADDGVLVMRGDDTSARGARGITLVLTK